MSPISVDKRVVHLGSEDTDSIEALERRCFVPPLRATAETLRRRFAAAWRLR